MALPRSRFRMQSSINCGHCEEYLSRTSFWRHRKACYNEKSGKWTKKTTNTSTFQAKSHVSTAECSQAFQSNFATSDGENSDMEMEITGNF